MIALTSTVCAQREIEIILFEASVNEFDVIGEESYEKYNRNNQDITEKVKPEIKTTSTAPASGGETFDGKNLLDGNMKTSWMSTGDGKNEDLEVIIDLEEVEGVNTAVLTYMYFFNGWRKDYHTWKDYSRIKKATMTVNDLPYGEITFEDTYKQQSIDFDKFKIDRTRRCRIRLRITDTYKGAKFNQVALSDVQFVGKAK
jgi:hypothetical protein